MLTSQEAATALKEADAAGQRSREAYSYSQGSPRFFIWGIAWMIGYGASALVPSIANWVWIPTIIIAVIASLAIKSKSVAAGRSAGGWRIMGMLAVAYLFSAGLFTLIWPLNGLQMAAYWPLLVAAIYAAAGLWLGLRFVIVGAVLAAATLGGYFFLRENFLLWMAVIGSGILILTGFWMRKV